MRTVSTKLEKIDFDKFLDQCNKDGVSQSEMLRNLVTDYCVACEEGEEIESEPKEESKVIISEVEEKPAIITHGKILDDDGNIIGTF